MLPKDVALLSGWGSLLCGVLWGIMLMVAPSAEVRFSLIGYNVAAALWFILAALLEKNAS